MRCRTSDTDASVDGSVAEEVVSGTSIVIPGNVWRMIIQQTNY